MRHMLQPVQEISLDRGVVSEDLFGGWSLAHGSMIPDKKIPPKRNENLLPNFDDRALKVDRSLGQSTLPRRGQSPPLLGSFSPRQRQEK